jgi:hypothetical protein
MTLGELKAAVIARLHRSDLAAQVPEFLRLAEAEYNTITNSTHDLTSEADAAENWVSEYMPQVYIMGALMQAAVYTQDDNALQKFAALFARAVEQAHYGEVRDSGVLDQVAETEIGVPSTFDIQAGY